MLHQGCIGFQATPFVTEQGKLRGADIEQLLKLIPELTEVCFEIVTMCNAQQVEVQQRCFFAVEADALFQHVYGLVYLTEFLEELCLLPYVGQTVRIEIAVERPGVLKSGVWVLHQLRWGMCG